MEARTAGYTLQELLISLGLIATLSASTLPALKDRRGIDEGRRFTLALTQALRNARALAVSSGERVTVCGSLDGVSCSPQWPGDVTLLAFTDRDGSYDLSSGDELHSSQLLKLQRGTGVWRVSLGRSYLRYRVDGSAVEYGRFSYCPTNGDEANFRQLVINRVGRVYQHHDGEGRSDHCD
jgi:type IV fimbrial biogenesis protein FimT